MHSTFQERAKYCKKICMILVDATFDSYHFLSRDVLTLKFVIPYVIIQFKSIN